MNFLKRMYKLRRFKPQSFEGGYAHVEFDDLELPMDIQTTEDAMITGPDGTESVQRLKVFCDYEIKRESSDHQIKADRVFFQNKWFECKSSRLSDNTPLRHWTCTFVECLDQEDEEDDDE